MATKPRSAVFGRSIWMPWYQPGGRRAFFSMDPSNTHLDGWSENGWVTRKWLVQHFWHLFLASCGDKNAAPTQPDCRLLHEGASNGATPKPWQGMMAPESSSSKIGRTLTFSTAFQRHGDFAANVVPALFHSLHPPQPGQENN